ncbi:zinc finger protein 215-like [Protopterus annectens]|uniref:zinc finger protein 215-like n=1 Tax=Protopterus annectens TaxID=7888 RepID=UPI001CFB45CF|nr:zinc finger protein 215-like [Protopterus annectens]
MSLEVTSAAERWHVCVSENAFGLDQYIKQEFAKLHQFLQEKEQKLIQQLKSDDVNILNETDKHLECIKHDIIDSRVAVSDPNLELKNEETTALKEIEEKSECIENDTAILETSDNNLSLRQQEPVELLRVPETFEDVIVTFSEEEWNMLNRQDKELYREVMINNYESMVSVVNAKIVSLPGSH